MADLFSEADEADSSRVAAPLAVRMRPRTLDEVVGQGHLLGRGSALRTLLQRAAPDGSGGAPGRIADTSLILWGPPGTGKTTLAHVVSRGVGGRFVELSAVTAGVKDVRAVMDKARDTRDLYGRTTVLFLDEIHRFSKSQQDALLPGVENGWVVLIAATTENPSFSVVSPLLSRSLVLTLRPLTAEDVAAVLARAVTDERGLADVFTLDADALDHLVRLADGDARRGLTSLEAAAAVAHGHGRTTITLPDAEQAVDTAALRYDRAGDQHYDVASAFIKSIRGSDVDAALHYLARMLEAGEDPRFIARRLVISASEDVGMADPSALQTAVAAAHAVQLIGMPEGRIVLAEAVVHLATAPKSNAAYVGINEAIADVRAGHAGQVPIHLRDASYAGATALGHGKGYRYAHDEPHGVARQQYAPDPLVGRRYYRPTDRGYEQNMAARLDRLRSVLGPEPPAGDAPSGEAPSGDAQPGEAPSGDAQPG